ncbi:hypothetical protein LLH00_19200 [bacterium]|nr:hypothetical protein [bacterium]
MHNRQSGSLKRLLLFLAAAIPSLLAAQKPPVAVSFEPLRQEWDWQDWASGLCGDFESALNRRYREGIPRREFTPEDKPVRLVYLLRMDPQGRILRFVPLSPEHRYLAYLIERTTREIALDLEGPPTGLPYPTVEGRLTFELRFRPTGFYKRHYFEEPLDSLHLPKFEPLIMVADQQPLYMYEPPDLDKNKLLADFRKRIGLGATISDTSLFTPLEVSGMYLALSLPYDSLRAGMRDTLRLRRQMQAALEKAGAHVLDEVPLEAYSSPPTAAALTVTDSSGQDSLGAAAAPDSSARDSLRAEIAAIEISEVKSNPAAVADSAIPVADLPKAFASVVNPKRTLVLSAGLARDSLPGKALCRVRLFDPGRPEDFKRRLDYVFKYEGELPDTLGQILVERLVHPPAKAAADSGAVKADSSAAAPATAPGAAAPAAVPAAPGAVKADSTAAGQAPAQAARSTAPADSAAKVPAGTPATAHPDSAAKAPAAAPAAAPADTATKAPAQPAAAPAAPPSDTAKSTAAPQAQAPETAAPAAAADSAKSAAPQQQ